jgi:hypothetical protein
MKTGIHASRTSVAIAAALVLGLAGTADAGPIAGDYYWQFDQKYTGTGEDSGAKDMLEPNQFLNYVEPAKGTILLFR